MNKPIAKILLALTLTLFSLVRTKAQDSLVTPRGDTIKVIVVVTPGREYTRKPVVRFTAPSTAERSSASYNNTPVSKPVRTTAADDDNTAPTTAERTGYHDYLNDHLKPRKHPNAIEVKNTNTPARLAATAPATSGAVTGAPSKPLNTANTGATGYHDYLNDNPKPVAHSNTNAGTRGTNTPISPVANNAATGAPSTPLNAANTGATGYHDYLNDSPKSATHSNSSAGANNTNTSTSAVAGNTVTGSSSTSSSTTTTTTTTTTTLPNGQKKVSVKKTDTVYIKKTDTVFVKQSDDKAHGMKAIYAEVGGPGLAISLNYDARFGSERKGWGYRIGAGYFADGYGNTVFTIPLQVNYLLTSDENNFLELGGGTTFINSTGSNKGKTFIFDRVTGFAGTATIGYRYQPVDHKLNFRIGFVPVFYDQGIIWAGGISVGYNFK
jgi:hypothetical protein